MGDDRGVLVGASAIAAVLITVRDIAGESIARRSAPFLVLAPAAIWIATSTDALTMGTSAWVVALLALAASRRDRAVTSTPWARDCWRLSRCCSPTASFCSPCRWWLSPCSRRARPLVLAGLVALGATPILALVGFWWLDGLFATTEQYHSLDLDRPYVPFLVINLAAWALALGPATVAGLAARDRRLWLIVGGGVLAALVAGLSGLSNGEVERIWLPFTIWVSRPAPAVDSRRPPEAGSRCRPARRRLITALIATNW